MSQIGTKMSQIPKYNFFGSSVPEGNFWCRNLFYNIWSRNYFVFQIGCFEKIRSNWMFRKIFSDLEISSKIFLSSKATVCLLTMHYCKAILTHLGHWVFIQHNSLTFFTVPWLKTSFLQVNLLQSEGSSMYLSKEPFFGIFMHEKPMAKLTTVSLPAS